VTDVSSALDQAIISAPLSKELSVADSELLWKFRYCLTKEKKALPKFLSCVDWTDDQQKEQANELLNLWQPIEPSEALALLGAKYKDKLIVRKYAISSLAKADDSVRCWTSSLSLSLSRIH